MTKYYDITEIPEDVTVTICKNGYGKDYYQLKKEYEKLKNENELLREEITSLRAGIGELNHTMISLRTIYNKETEDIEEL